MEGDDRPSDGADSLMDGRRSKSFSAQKCGPRSDDGSTVGHTVAKDSQHLREGEISMFD